MGERCENWFPSLDWIDDPSRGGDSEIGSETIVPPRSAALGSGSGLHSPRRGDEAKSAAQVAQEPPRGRLPAGALSALGTVGLVFAGWAAFFGKETFGDMWRAVSAAGMSATALIATVFCASLLLEKEFGLLRRVIIAFDAALIDAAAGITWFEAPHRVLSAALPCLAAVIFAVAVRPRYVRLDADHDPWDIFWAFLQLLWDDLTRLACSPLATMRFRRWGAGLATLLTVLLISGASIESALGFYTHFDPPKTTTSTPSAISPPAPAKPGTVTIPSNPSTPPSPEPALPQRSPFSSAWSGTIDATNLSWADVCGLTAPLPGLGAPEWVKMPLVELWIGQGQPGALAAGCTDEVHPIPGHPDVFFTYGRADDGTIMSIGFVWRGADGSVHSGIALAPAVNDVLGALKSFGEIDLSSRFRIGGGDAYIIGTVDGSTLLIRPALGGASATSYTEVDPPAVDAMLRAIDEQREWLWPRVVVSESSAVTIDLSPTADGTPAEVIHYNAATESARLVSTGETLIGVGSQLTSAALIERFQASG